MIPELTCAKMDDPVKRPAAWTSHGAGLLPLWLTQQEAEAFLQLCAASPVFAGDAAEGLLFGKLGELLRAFRH